MRPGPPTWQKQNIIFISQFIPNSIMVDTTTTKQKAHIPPFTPLPPRARLSRLHLSIHTFFISQTHLSLSWGLHSWLSFVNIISL